MNEVPCGGPDCLMGTLAHSVRTLSDDVASLHQTVMRLRPDTWLERLRNISLTVAGALVSGATCVWLYDRFFAL